MSENAEGDGPLAPGAAARQNLIRFGRWVRLFRMAMALSQEELGERAGLDRSTVGSIERGERNIGIVYVWQLAHALEVRPEDLFAQDAPHPLQLRRMPVRDPGQPPPAWPR